MKSSHRQTIGYIAFFLALGILLGVIISSKLLAIFIIVVLLILGYCCICC